MRIILKWKFKVYYFFWFGMREVLRVVLFVLFLSLFWDNINVVVKGYGFLILILFEIEDKFCCKLKIMKLLYVDML